LGSATGTGTEEKVIPKEAQGGEGPSLRSSKWEDTRSKRLYSKRWGVMEGCVNQKKKKKIRRGFY